MRESAWELFGGNPICLYLYILCSNVYSYLCIFAMFHHLWLISACKLSVNEDRMLLHYTVFQCYLSDAFLQCYFQYDFCFESNLMDCFQNLRFLEFQQILNHPPELDVVRLSNSVPFLFSSLNWDFMIV